MKTTRILWSLWLIPAALTLLGMPAAQADTIKMKLISSGAADKRGVYSPHELMLSDKAPDGLKKAPEGLVAPLYGTITMGPKEKPTSFLVIVDEPDGKDARLFVDTNANGDLTDDPATEWKVDPRDYPPDSGLKGHIGGATVQLQVGGETVSLHLGMYRFDKRDPNGTIGATGKIRTAYKNVLHYYADYASEGEVTLGGKTYKVMFTDDKVTGDFRGKQGPGAHLWIDVHQNGMFDRLVYVSQPFNIAGTTYEITEMSPLDSTFQIVKSAKSVPEPLDLIPGKKSLSFEAKTTGGQSVQFPSSFKGKIVMLDFWATWCGPCVAELPGLAKAYSQYHARGFEVLGISLDQEGAEKKLATFTTEHKMPWQQVYDGKSWSGKLAQLFEIQGIPAAFLVDGDTGEVLASGGDLRGERLAETVKRALEKKKL